jgi:hypothetical protein
LSVSSDDWEDVVSGPWTFQVAPDGSRASGNYRGEVVIPFFPNPRGRWPRWGPRRVMEGCRSYVPDPDFWPYLEVVHSLMLRRGALAAAASVARRRSEYRRVADPVPGGWIVFSVQPFGRCCWVWEEDESGGRGSATIHLVPGGEDTAVVNPAKTCGSFPPARMSSIQVRAGRLMRKQATFARP